jgi:hypothetical protein
MSDGATGIGASELVDCPDLALEALETLAAPEVAVSPPAPAASCEGCGALPNAPDAAPAALGRAHAIEHAIEHAKMVNGRATTRA